MKFEKIFIKDIDSTHTYLINLIKNKRVAENIAIYSNKQTKGIGSRGNLWNSDEGNLYLSFAVFMGDLPSDLQVNSSSIYFAYLAKLTLATYGKDSWVKWPNDLYVNDLKLGGVITNKIENMLVCGIGVNFKNPPSGAFGYKDIEPNDFLNAFLDMVCLNISWREIFLKYIHDFDKSRKFYFNLGNKIVSLEDAFLYQDGSILLENQRIYSLR